MYRHIAKIVQVGSTGGFRGGLGGSLKTPSRTKLFQFYVEIYEKRGKMLKTNPLLRDLNNKENIGKA